MEETSKSTVDHTKKFVSFKLGEQEFCVDIMAVREIRGWTKPTPIPHAPPYVSGVINLRGTVLPIMDFSARLGMPPMNPDESHVTIVMQIQDNILGIIVDAVSDILSIDESTIQPTPEIGSKAAKEQFKGVVALENNRMIRLVELDSLALTGPKIEAA